jgi:hypothetical protein
VIDRAYVVDIAVNDLAAANARVGQILGMPAVPTSEYNPAGVHIMNHFPVGGINALGLVSVKEVPRADSPVLASRYLAIAGEGAYLVGFLVPDIVAHQKELAARGIPLVMEVPHEYKAGRLNMTSTIHGTTVEFAQHFSADESALWMARADAATDRIAQRACAFDIAVRDLDSAITVFSHVLGLGSPTRTRHEDYLCASFDVTGLDVIRLVTPASQPTHPRAVAAARRLAAHGDGPYLLGFTADLNRAMEHLRSVSLTFAVADAGKSLLTAPVCGVTFEFTSS